MTTSKLTLNAAIAACPDSMFGDVDKGIPPKFAKIFARAAVALLKDRGEKFDEATVQLVADTINPSSMQRVVAKHRSTLTGVYNKATGKYEPIPEKAPRKERGKPRPSKDEDDLGLGASKPRRKVEGEKPTTKKAEAVAKERATKPVSKNTELAKAKSKKVEAAKKLKAAAEKEAKAQKAPEKAEKKADNAKKAAKTGLDAIAAARASLAAKKAAKAGKTEAEVEI